jgi:hypothetical protein
MTMTKNCFIQWDDLSYKLNDSNSNFSIQNLPGLPYKITWDNSQHIINNHSDYSYQLFWGWYLTGYTRRGFLGCSYPVTFDILWLSPSGPVNYACNNHLLTENVTLPTIPPPSSTDIDESINWSHSLRNTFVECGQTLRNINVFRNGSFTGTWMGHQTTTNLNYGFDKRIRIIDNGVTYFYPINDRNSVQVVNSIGENKIIIEDQAFDILDVNSARKYCDDNCPNGTIECGCNGKKCCYEKVFYGYKLVKVI